LTLPTDQLGRLVDEIATHGAVRRGYLGVAVQRVRLPRAIAEQLGRASGALVLGVDDDSPAATAGLVLGDVIVELGGAAVDGPDGLRAVLAIRAGATASVRTLRAGGWTELEITVGQRGAR
jgi:S1-C subfamily serine protease